MLLLILMLMSEAEVGARNWGWSCGAGLLGIEGRIMLEENSEGSCSEGSESRSESDTSSMRAC